MSIVISTDVMVTHQIADGIALGAAASAANTELELVIFIAIMLHKVISPVLTLQTVIVPCVNTYVAGPSWIWIGQFSNA